MNIEEIINEAIEKKEAFEKAKKDYDELRKKIEKYFDSNKNTNKMKKIITDKGYAQIKERISVIYHINKLKKKLNSKLLKIILTKRYEITNINGLTKLLKAHNINPKEFKKYINVIETVDNDVIANLFKIGQITKSDLEGCFKAKITKYVEIRKGGTD